MNKIIFILVFIFLGSSLLSQELEYERMYFLEFKVYQTDFENEVPFAELCISDKNGFVFNCEQTDFNGNCFFHLNPKSLNLDSTYLKIRLFQGHVLQGGILKEINDYGEPIIIPFDQVGIFKTINLENEIKISLTDYKILSDKEYKKHIRKYKLLPQRKPHKIK